MSINLIDMKKVLFLFIFFTPIVLIAQNVGINGSGASPDPSAMLDVSSLSSGLLVPRVALSATNLVAPIAAPATALLVYNTSTAGVPPNDVTPGFYYWNGTLWVRFGASGEDWSTTGNAGTVVGTNFLGTTDLSDFEIRVNNIRSGYLGIGIEANTLWGYGAGFSMPINNSGIMIGTFAGADALNNKVELLEGTVKN